MQAREHSCLQTTVELHCQPASDALIRMSECHLATLDCRDRDQQWCVEPVIAQTADFDRAHAIDKFVALAQASALARTLDSAPQQHQSITALVEVYRIGEYNPPT